MLSEARRLGFLGPSPVEVHVRHSLAYQECPLVAQAGLGLDLGSGGGVPGLLLACDHAMPRWVLLDAHQARTTFLREAVTVLGLTERVSVVNGRAEEVGRDARHRGAYDVVVARSFGPPAVTAECGAPLLRVGGGLVVSEPPEGGARWPDDGLAQLGLDPASVSSGPPRLVSMVQRHPCPDRYPRRVGIPGKRPLW